MVLTELLLTTSGGVGKLFIIQVIVGFTFKGIRLELLLSGGERQTKIALPHLPVLLHLVRVLAHLLAVVRPVRVRLVLALVRLAQVQAHRVRQALALVALARQQRCLNERKIWLK